MVESHEPVVEMLWEELDPRSVLTERFGFPDAASSARWVAATVHEYWDVRVRSCDRVVMSDRNALAWLGTSTGPLVAKWSVAHDRFGRLGEVARLTRWLDEQGLPVSAPLPALDGRLQVETARASMSVQRVVPGDLLDVGDGEQVRAAGAVLARLHRALARYPDADRFVPGDARPPGLAERVLTWEQSSGSHVPTAARDVLSRRVAEAPAETLPTQLLHGDFRSSNVLCAGPTVTAVLDLEEARVDHCVDEVARSAVMLGTRFRDWAPVSADVRATFLDGYRSVRALTPVEEAWLDVLVLWYAFALVPTGTDPAGWGASARAQLAAVAGRA